MVSRLIIAALILLAPCPVFAGEMQKAASDIDTGYIFEFAEGSDIGEKGEREIESVYAIPVTVLIDKELIEGKLFAVANLVHMPSFLCVNGVRDHDESFEEIAGLTYALGPHIFAGGEIRHQNLAENGTFTHDALFVGPNLFYRFSETFTVKVAWTIQIPDAGAAGLDLTAYQRHQVELQFAYNF